MWTSALAASLLKACFPAKVSYADVPSCSYMKTYPVTLSTYIVAHVYRLFFIAPTICATNPGVGEIIWSTETTSPGSFAGVFGGLFFDVLFLHDLRFALPNIQAAHFGNSHDLYLAGIIPWCAISRILENGIWLL